MENEQQAVYDLIEQHYRENRKRLVNRARGATKNWAEDAVQETYMRACQYWNSYDYNRPFDGWMAGLYKNAVRYAANLNRTHMGMDDDRDLDTLPQHSFIDPFYATHIKEIIALIDKEPEDKAYILKLALIHEFKACEIAEIVDDKPNSIAQMVQRYQKELRKHFQ